MSTVLLAGAMVFAFGWIATRGVSGLSNFIDAEEARAKGRPVTKWTETEDTDEDEY